MRRMHSEGYYPHIKRTWKEFLSIPEREQRKYLGWLDNHIGLTIDEAARVFRVSRNVLTKHCEKIDYDLTCAFRNYDRTPEREQRISDIINGRDKITVGVNSRMRRYDKIVDLKAQGFSNRVISMMVGCSQATIIQVNYVWSKAENHDTDALKAFVEKFTVPGMVRWACIRNGIDVEVMCSDDTGEEKKVEKVVEVPKAAAVYEPPKMTFTEFNTLKEFNGHMRFLRMWLANPTTATA